MRGRYDARKAEVVCLGLSGGAIPLIELWVGAIIAFLASLVLPA